MLSWNDSPMYVYSVKFSTRIEELLPDWHLWIWDWIYLSSPCMTSPRWLFVIAHSFVNFKLVKDNSPYVARRLEDLSSGLYKSTSWSTHQPISDIYNPSHHKVQHVEKRESRIVKKNAIFVMELKKTYVFTVSRERRSSSFTAMWKRRSSPSKESWLPSQPLRGFSPTIRSTFNWFMFHTIPASCLWW